jgi:hypothetical protein
MVKFMPFASFQITPIDMRAVHDTGEMQQPGGMVIG